MPDEASDRSHALAARAEALQAALDEARARAGVERLAGLQGVLGTLADLVDDRRGLRARLRGGGRGRSRDRRRRRDGRGP